MRPFKRKTIPFRDLKCGGAIHLLDKIDKKP